MTTYIIDNSMLQAAGRSDNIAERLRQISPHELVLTCPPLVLEYCFSARSGGEHDLLREDLSEFAPAEHHPTEQLVLEIQADLWRRGYVRAAGVADIQIAAYAIVNNAVVLTADRDFEVIAAVVPEFRCEYVPAA